MPSPSSPPPQSSSSSVKKPNREHAYKNANHRAWPGKPRIKRSCPHGVTRCRGGGERFDTCLLDCVVNSSQLAAPLKPLLTPSPTPRPPPPPSPSPGVRLTGQLLQLWCLELCQLKEEPQLRPSLWFRMAFGTEPLQSWCSWNYADNISASQSRGIRERRTGSPATEGFTTHTSFPWEPPQSIESTISFCPNSISL